MDRDVEQVIYGSPFLCDHPQEEKRKWGEGGGASRGEACFPLHHFECVRAWPGASSLVDHAEPEASRASTRSATRFEEEYQLGNELERRE